MVTNPQLDLAFHFVEQTNRNIFLTGKAGTGKTTFLHKIKELSPKRMVVVAPTGVAAINASGVTIHSFFQMPFGPHLPKEALAGSENKYASGYTKISKNKMNIIRSLDLLVIDEISMVRADLLDGIDEVLRRYRYSNKPFGGVQLLMIGDIRQLSPIVKDDERQLLQPYYTTFYFYGSRALQKTNFISIELTHIFRQSDTVFKDILNKIRDKTITTEQLEMLNQRHLPQFKEMPGETYIRLTTHNNKAHSINSEKLEQINDRTYQFEAHVHNDFPEYLYPTEEQLLLKKGAQVMFIKNDPNPEKEFYNGKIGIVEGVVEHDETVVVKCPEDNSRIYVGRLTWENTKYKLNDETKEIEEQVIGKFEQIPLKLAWAITIHKSQGLTFDKAIIDAQRSFAHGQVYVALSRCRSLEGLVLSSPIDMQSIKTDHSVSQFSEEIEANPPSKNDLQQAQKEYQKELLEEQFNFKLIAYQLGKLREQTRVNAASLLSNLNHKLATTQQSFNQEIFTVAEKFKLQLYNLLQENNNGSSDHQVNERLTKAAKYFLEKSTTILDSTLVNLPIETDNQQVKKEIEKILKDLLMNLQIKKAGFKVCEQGFSLKSFVEARSKAAIEQPKKKPKTNKQTANENIKYPELYELLREWRNQLADEEEVQVYQIITQKAMAEIATTLPANTAQLLKVNGLGKKRIQKYGEQILQIIEAYCNKNDIDYQANLAIAFPDNKKKPDTKLVSLELYHQGKTIEEIAKERGFVPITIQGHLAHFVETGELEIAKFVSPDQLKEIMQEIKSEDNFQLAPLKERLNDKYDYGILRMVMAHYKMVHG